MCPIASRCWTGSLTGAYGPQQIWPQIKSLDDFTPIKVEIKIEW
jgi:hypothetical protein